MPLYFLSLDLLTPISPMGLQFFLYALVQLVLAAAGWWLAGVWGVVVALVLLAWLGLLLHNWQAQRVLRWLSMGAIAAQMPPVPGLWGQAAGRMRRLLREAAATAAASDARLHEILAALQASPNGVTLVDAQGRIEWCNHMAQSHFGVEPERDARQSLAYLLRVPEFNAYVAAQDFSEEVVLPGRDSSPERPIHISVQIFPYGDGRQLVLSTLQNHPELAQNMQVSTPECDFDKCTSCGECVNVCPTFACDLVGSGRFALESTYCLGCGACVKVCPEHALKLVEHDASNLVVVDPEAEEKAAQKAKAHEEAEKVKAEAKAKLDKMLDQVEKLAD